ncbi:MAG: hypothetical protein QOH06_1508 [Acidobacteriota bacterium]|jgi:hypothetical protein|nr:hypothetical protein [Acidobacteriota bacterium]
MRCPPVLSVLPVLAVLAAAPLAAQVPVGLEIFVKQQAGRQDVGVAADGSFVMAWETADRGRVRVRRYRANGKPQGGELRVSRLGEGRQTAPAVAVRPDGSFVVVWNRVAAGDKRVEVYASRFTAGGQAIGEPRFVGYAAQASAGEPAAATLLPGGGFFVAWTLEDGFVGDTPSRDLYGRRFTRNGVPAGGRVTLNEDPAGDQRHPECAVSRGAELVCTWTSDLGEGSFGETLFRRFDLDGRPLGDELQVNEPDTTGHAQRHPSIAVHADGTVLVAWLDVTDVGRVHARLLDAEDRFLGPAFLVGEAPPLLGDPRAAATDAGFAVVWAVGNAVLLRGVGADGAVAGAERQVNERFDGTLVGAAIAFGPAGGAVVWTSYGALIRDVSIRARRLR